MKNLVKKLYHNHLGIFIGSASFRQYSICQGSSDHDIPAEHGISLFRAHAEAA